MYQLKHLNIEWLNSIYYTHQAGEIVVEHDHNAYEFILYKNGTGRINSGVLEYPYADSTLTIIPPNVKHGELTLTTTSVFCLQIQFPQGTSFPLSFINPSKQNKQLLSIIETTIKALCYKWYKHNSIDLVNLNELKSTNENIDDLSVRDLILKLMLYVNTLTLSKDKEQYIRNSITYAKNFLIRNCTHKVNYLKLAESLGYSYSRFRYLFSKQAGLTLKQFQLGIQFSRAKQLLFETTYPIKKIASLCGFASDVRFVSEFKNKFNLTPQQYRKLLKTPADINGIIIPPD